MRLADHLVLSCARRVALHGAAWTWLLISAAAQRVWLDERVHTLVPQDSHETELEQPVAFGDFDGDGDLDLVRARTIALNDGGGVFRQTQVLSQVQPGFARVRAYAAGDFDGDGDIDVFVAKDRAEELWLNDGSAHFAPGGQLPAEVLHDETEAVVAGDLDRDGDLDLLLGDLGDNGKIGYWRGRVRLWLNAGNATFVDATERVEFGAGTNPIAFALADFDGDGDLDLCFANSLFPGFNNRCELLLNDGHAYFGDHSSQLPPISFWEQHTSVAAGDLDGDGDVDLLVGGDHWLRNLGHGRFSDASASLPLGGITALWGAIGDVDGDHDLDIVCADLIGGSRLLVNQNNQSFVLAPAAIDGASDGTERPALQDVDGDGDLDLHLSISGAGDLLLNDGTGRFVLPQSGAFARLGGRAGDAAFGDVDGDGDVDLYLAQFGQDELRLNDGRGAFLDASAQLPVESNVGGLAELVDLDGDHDLDLVLANISYYVATTQALAVYSNDGTGHFSDTSAQWSAPALGVRSLAVADVDGDGDQDVFTGTSSSGTLPPGDRLFLNDGAGNLAEIAGYWPAGTNTTSAVAFGDLDGDGDLDAVTGDQHLRRYVNDGTGHFQLVTAPLLALYSYVWDLELCDVDGDGDLDVVAGSYAPPALLLNNGAGVFTVASSHLPPLPQSSPGISEPLVSIAAGDVDLDGDVDLWVTAGYSNQSYLWLNDGAGTFTDAGPALAISPLSTSHAQLLDLDYDGDLDGFVPNGGGESFVVPNLTRHVAWSTPPRIGRTLEMSVRGTPNEAFLLLASHGRAFTPLGSLGTFQLDRNMISARRYGQLDAAGRASASFAIANDPALVGTSLYWQALIANPRKLTNLEITTFLAL